MMRCTLVNQAELLATARRFAAACNITRVWCSLTDYQAHDLRKHGRRMDLSPGVTLEYSSDVPPGELRGE